MNKVVTLLVVASCFVVPAFEEAAAGILGRPILGASAGKVWPHDEAVKAFDDSIVTYNASLRVPVNANVDLVGNLGQSLAEGLVEGYEIEATGTYLSLLLQYQFAPRAVVNPFVEAGILWARYEEEYSDDYYYRGETIYEDDDVGFTFGGGLELNFDEQLSLNLGAAYETEIMEADEIAVSAGLNLWATPNLLLSLYCSHGFESENTGLAGGISFGF